MLTSAYLEDVTTKLDEEDSKKEAKLRAKKERVAEAFSRSSMGLCPRGR